MSGFSLRRTTSLDMAEIDALLARSFPKLVRDCYPPSVMVTALPPISRAQPWLLDCGTYYAVEHDNRIVGVGGWTVDLQTPDMGHIRHVATDPAQVRQGVGRMLMTHIRREAASAGMRILECWSTRNAVPFYAALGFLELGPIDVPLQPGITFPAIEMRMVLASALARD